MTEPSTPSASEAAVTLPPSMRDRVPYLLYRASEHSHALANSMLARIGLTARQVGILTLVIEREPMTQKVLGDILGIDRTTMVSLIDDLERKGLVARQRHPRDRRAFLICPTESGQTAKAEAIAILDDQQRQFLAPLSFPEQQQLAALLKRLQRPPGEPDLVPGRQGDRRRAGLVAIDALVGG
jgi:MarR family transcriptional regulator, lower aerobic nicotinate degradation pathway regulator